MDNFGQWVKEQRELNGLSLTEAGRRIGVSRQYVWQLEQGDHSPTLRTAERVCGAFGTVLWRVLQKLDNGGGR